MLTLSQLDLLGVCEMSDRTIVCEVGPDGSLRLSKADGDFLGLRPGARLVMEVNKNERVPGVGMSASLKLAEGSETKRRPSRAFS